MINLSKEADMPRELFVIYQQKKYPPAAEGVRQDFSTGRFVKMTKEELKEDSKKIHHEFMFWEVRNSFNIGPWMLSIDILSFFKKKGEISFCWDSVKDIEKAFTSLKQETTFEIDHWTDHDKSISNNRGYRLKKMFATYVHYNHAARNGLLTPRMDALFMRTADWLKGDVLSEEDRLMVKRAADRKLPLGKTATFENLSSLFDTKGQEEKESDPQIVEIFCHIQSAKKKDDYRCAVDRNPSNIEKNVRKHRYLSLDNEAGSEQKRQEVYQAMIEICMYKHMAKHYDVLDRELSRDISEITQSLASKLDYAEIALADQILAKAFHPR